MAVCGSRGAFIWEGVTVMRRSRLCVMGVLSLAVGLATGVSAAEVQVDCGKVIGRIRPLHGGNCGPLQSGGLIDLSDYFREVRIPHTRLHDCHWPNPDVVDIHTIFPDFGADPAQAGSYRFSRTDEYVQSIVAVGSQIVYRLGESIEHTPTKYYVHPPADYEKWAAVCIGIIRHYNEGWAKGFRHDIRYWEIWNEPENRPAMWTGSDEQYLKLYEVTAKAIKERFPALKLGGPSLGYTGRVVDGRFEPSAFLVKFLEHCRERGLPLDFLSWHLYTNDPAECMVRAKGLREVLDRHGFGKAELHFNEWNYLPDNDWSPMGLRGQGVKRERFYERMGGPEGAAFAACVLMNLQDSPVDVANYFKADTGGFSLFTPHGAPYKVFHAFKAFGMLLDTPVRVETRGGEPGRLVVCAGMNEGKSEVGVLVSNYGSPDKRIQLRIAHLPWEGAAVCRVYVVDDAHDLAMTREFRLPAGDMVLEEALAAPGVCLIKISRDAPETAGEQ